MRTEKILNISFSCALNFITHFAFTKTNPTRANAKYNFEHAKMSKNCGFSKNAKLDQWISRLE